jgi:nicotinamidase-related amidase
MGARVIQASHRFVSAPIPILVLIDLQVEHLASEGPLRVNEAGEVLETCGRLLASARAARLPVAHFRRIGQSAVVDRAARHSAFIGGFAPRPGEMLFDREGASCYSARDFHRFCEHAGAPFLVLAGFGANYVALATAVDAHTHGHKLWLVADGLGTCGTGHSMPSLSPVLAQFGELVNAEAVTRSFEQLRGGPVHGRG